MKNELSLLASNKNIYQGSNQISEDFMFLHKKWNLLNALWFQAKSYACHWLLNWWSLIHVHWKIAVISVFTDTLTVVIKHQNYSHEENYITFPRSHNTWSTTCPPKLIIKSKNHLIYAKEHRIWKPSFLSLLFCGKLLPYINLHSVTGWWVTNLLNPELSPFLATVQHTTSMLMPRVYESSVAWASLAPVHNKNSKHLFIWRQEHVKYRSTETHGRPLQRLQTC